MTGVFIVHILANSSDIGAFSLPIIMCKLIIVENADKENENK